MDNLKRDRFELLSAYLDGEVTAAERKEVESLLESDPSMQHLYARLLKLRQTMQSGSVFFVEPVEPTGKSTESSVEQTIQEVFSRLERKPKSIVWIGTAVAALFVGLLTEMVPVERPVMQQAIPAPASSSVTSPLRDEGLMIAINHPVIRIPKGNSSGQFENGSVADEPNRLNSSQD
jgi:anti-sigma factor RsiW